MIFQGAHLFRGSSFVARNFVWESDTSLEGRNKANALSIDKAAISDNLAPYASAIRKIVLHKSLLVCAGRILYS